MTRSITPRPAAASRRPRGRRRAAPSLVFRDFVRQLEKLDAQPAQGRARSRAMKPGRSDHPGGASSWPSR